MLLEFDMQWKATSFCSRPFWFHSCHLLTYFIYW